LPILNSLLLAYYYIYLTLPIPVPSPDEKGGGLGREYSTLPVKLTGAGAVQLGSLLHGAHRRQLMANPNTLETHWIIRIPREQAGQIKRTTNWRGI
jgi:hypothetical protein